MLIFMGGFPTMISSLIMVQAAVVVFVGRTAEQCCLLLCVGQAIYAIHGIDNAKL
jgi:hypothetical protein